MDGATMEEKFNPVNGLEDLQKDMLEDSFTINRSFRFAGSKAGDGITITKFRKSPKGAIYERGSYHIAMYADCAGSDGKTFPVVIKFAVKKEKKVTPKEVGSRRRRSSDDYDFHYSFMNIPHMNKLIMNCHKTCEFLKLTNLEQFKVNGAAIIHGQKTGFHWLELELKSFKKFATKKPASAYPDGNHNKAYGLCNPQDPNLIKLQVLMQNLTSDYICDIQGELDGEKYTFSDIEYASNIWSWSIVNFMDPTHLELFTSDKKFALALESYHLKKTPELQNMIVGSVLKRLLQEPQILDLFKSLTFIDEKDNKKE